MNEIQQNRYDQLIRRVAGIIGPGSKVSEVLTELFPVIDVERVPGELLILAGTRIAMGGGIVSALAAVAPKAQLFNPAGSETIITLTQVVITVVPTNIIRWGRSNVSFAANNATAAYRDYRNAITNIPVGQVHALNVAALATATGQTKLLSNTPLILKDENGIAVLEPGSGFEIGAGVVQADLNWAFFWRERPAQPSELSL